MRILVIVPAVPTAAHLEVLAAARSLGTVAAASLGAPDRDLLARHGVATAYVPDLGGRTDPAAVAEGVAAVVRLCGPDAVLLVSSFAGKSVAARLAVEFDGGAVADVSALRLEGGRIVAGKAVLAGNWETECTVTRGLPVFALKPTAFAAAEVPPAALEVVPVAVTLSAATTAVLRTARTVHPGGRPPLEQARVVVAGGRGMDGDFSLVEQLADQLGGAVGATRVATDEGWIDHSAQIGQTGTMIAPRLYIGAGISGAVHHTAGIRAAEVIVAIDSDADAPIFEMVDFGVVGDVRDVLPQLLDALRAAR